MMAVYCTLCICLGLNRRRWSRIPDLLKLEIALQDAIIIIENSIDLGHKHVFREHFRSKTDRNYITLDPKDILLQNGDHLYDRRFRDDLNFVPERWNFLFSLMSIFLFPFKFQENNFQALKLLNGSGWGVCC